MLRLICFAETGTLKVSSRLPRTLGVAALALLIASPALAAGKKKKEGGEATEPPAAATDSGPVAPEADSMGRVHFGDSAAEGIGRVTVQAAAKDRVQVFLDGRYFGRAPMTIYSVPKGDYIVEGHYPDGRQISRPVSVSESEEASVDISAGKIETPGGGGDKPGLFGGDISPERLLMTKVLVGAAAVALVFGVTFGILEMKAESDWKNATEQSQQDSISSRGRRDATLANIGFVATGAFLVGAAVAGYPMLGGSSREKSTAVAVTPVVTPDLTGGMVTLRF